MKSIDDLIELRIKQAQFLKRINSDKQYLDYKKKQILKSMEEGEEYDFTTMYDLNKGYFNGDEDMFYKSINIYRRGDREGINGIFDAILDKHTEDIKDIEKTLVKLPILEPKKSIYDY
jgi:hypothetical protein